VGRRIGVVIENPDLVVTFSDEEDDEAGKVPSMQQHDILPNLQCLIYIGHEVNWGGHDYLPLESTVYHIEDVKLSIKGPIHLADITDHPSYYFLTQVEEELNRLGDEIKSSRYLSPTGKTEINFDFSLLGTKIVHYASHYGHSTSPSWTLANSASQEAIFLRKLANELGFIQTHPTIIYEDCESAVALSKENRFRKRSKHIDVRWSFIVEKQRHGDLRVVSVSRTIMLADILCSPRAAATFSIFRNKILGYQTPHAASGDGLASIPDAHGRTDDRSAKASSTAHKDSGDGSHK